MNRTSELNKLICIYVAPIYQPSNINLFMKSANTLNTLITNIYQNITAIHDNSINNLFIEYNKLKHILSNQYVVSTQQKEHYNQILNYIYAYIKHVQQTHYNICNQRVKLNLYKQYRLSKYGSECNLVQASIEPTLRKRNTSCAKNIEKSITELGNLNKQLSDIVISQSEKILDIENNIDTGYTNTQIAHAYILLLPKSQYMLIIKTFIMLILFIIFFTIINYKH